MLIELLESKVTFPYFRINYGSLLTTLLCMHDNT